MSPCAITPRTGNRLRLAAIRTPAVLAIILSGFAFPAQAGSFAELSAAIDAADWQTADQIARELDIAEGSDFFQAYAKASQLTADGQCEAADPLLDAIAVAKPYFVPVHELSYYCDRTLGRFEDAIAELEKIEALVHTDAERQIVRQMLANEKAASGVSVVLYGDVTPSTNVNRQTTETELQGLKLTEASRGKSGISATAGARLTKRLYAQQDLFVAGVQEPELSYSTSSQLLTPALTTSIPLTFSLGGGARASVSPFLSKKFGPSSTEQTRLGVQATVTEAYGSTDSFTYSASLARQTHAGRAYLDGWNATGQVSWSHVVGPQTTTTLRMNIDATGTDDPTNSSVEASLTGRIDQYWQNSFVVGVEATVGMRAHNQPPPLSMGPNQTDRFIKGRLELSHQGLTIGPFMPAIVYTYQWQDSDNVFYRYQSHDFGLSLKAKL